MAENKFNNEETIARCVPMGRLQSVIGGKWKILILWYVFFYKVQRFGESFIPVLQTMMAWSETYLCPDWQNSYEKDTLKLHK